jgi:hypothetical protein
VLGITIADNFLQLENALDAIFVMDSGKVTLIKLLQERNADEPIEVTELGNTMLVKMLQS